MKRLALLAAVRQRLSSAQGLKARQWWLIALICLAMVILVQRYVRLGVNVSGSLPERLFIYLKHTMPYERGQYVVFAYQGRDFYPRGSHFTKIVRGLPGDRIEVTPGGLVSVAGQTVGLAKRFAKNGVPLQPTEPGVVPAGHFFVAGAMADSLDSRYTQVGLVKFEHVLGRAYAIY